MVIGHLFGKTPEVNAFFQAFVIPDFFFYDAKRYDDRRELSGVLKQQFLPWITGFREPEDILDLQRHIDTENQYGLCPVTERIVRRFLRARRAGIPLRSRRRAPR